MESGDAPWVVQLGTLDQVALNEGGLADGARITKADANVVGDVRCGEYAGTSGEEVYMSMVNDKCPRRESKRMAIPRGHYHCWTRDGYVDLVSGAALQY